MLDDILHVSRAKTLSPICSTGLHSVDNALGGGLFSGVTYLTGMPGTGKTTLALQACCAARANESLYSLFVSLEMSYTAVIAKLASLESTQETSNPDEYLTVSDFHNVSALGDAKFSVLLKTMNRLRSEQFQGFELLNEISDTSALNLPGEIEEMIEGQWSEGLISDSEYEKLFNEDGKCTLRTAHLDMARYGIEGSIEHGEPRVNAGLIVIDYLQKARDDRYPTDDTGRIAQASAQLTELARDAPIPLAILAVSSMSRSGYKCPTALASMAGSSAMEYDAEAVIAIEHDEAYIPTAKEAKSMERNGLRRIKLTITKNRHGSCPITIPLWFDGAHSRFIEVAKNAQKKNGGVEQC